MDAIAGLIGLVVGFFAGRWFWTRQERQRVATEAHNLSIARRKDITDAINDSKAGGAADPADWLKRLRADNQRNGNL
jgi:hypothetical protein